MDVLERAISAAGGLKALAARLNCKPQVIVNWRARGVPAGRVLQLELATDGKVTRHELRPDLYPPEHTGVAAAE